MYFEKGESNVLCYVYLQNIRSVFYVNVELFAKNLIKKLCSLNDINSGNNLHKNYNIVVKKRENL